MYDGYRPKTQSMDFRGSNTITSIEEAETAEEEAMAASAMPGGASLFQTLRPHAPQDTKKAFLPQMSTRPDILKQTLPTNFGTSTRKLMSTSHDAFRLPDFAEKLRSYRESSLHNLGLSADVTRSNNPHRPGVFWHVKMSNGVVSDDAHRSTRASHSGEGGGGRGGH